MRDKETKMAQCDAIGQLKDCFSKQLGDFEKRRIIIWHDIDGSFEAEFDSLEPKELKGERTLHLAKAEEGSMFALKRALYRDSAGDDFLIYTREQKNLSAKALEGNWIADIELIAEHFQADFASMLMDDLGAADGAVEGIEVFKSFFNAQDRRQRFKKLMPAAQTKQDVALGVIGSVLGAEDLSTECLVRTYVISLSSDDSPLEKLGKYGADAAWGSFLTKRIGYEADLESLEGLAAHILITALSFQLPDGALDGLEGRISAPHGQFCLNIVHDWMDNEGTSDELFELCRRIENLCNLEQRFSQFTALALCEADIFPCINERIVVDLFTSMANGADRSDEASKVLQRRSDMRWHTRVTPYFDALEQAILIQQFHRQNVQGFHYAKPTDVWAKYTDPAGGWWRMDSAYRNFCKAADAAQKSTYDLPIAMDDSMEALASWMERVYVNWFLSETNRCWIGAAESSWERFGHIEGIRRQRNFFDEYVISGAAGAKKTLVIISDALRYEVAAELAQRLEQDTRGSAKLDSMHSVFPSITEFGMAALLPHSSLSFSMDNGCVYANVDMPTVSRAQREAILRTRKPSARCIQSKDLFAAKRAVRKEMVGDADVVYVYHNKIDSVGEDYSTEHDVFEACDTAIDDIVALVKMATGDLAFSRILITADHGFLYTREPLDESGKVSGKDIAGSTLSLGRRYAISGDWPGDALFIKMNMDDIDGGSYVGIAPRECIRIKKPGPGENYVHGGLSLQECCVPVIQFRNMRTGAKGYEESRPATLQMLSTSRRVTSLMFKVDLFQKDRVEGKVLPAEYEVCMVDPSGNEVSDVRKAHADMSNPDETARVCRIQLGLKAGRQYDPKKTYYLLCREKATGQIAWKEEYQIDIPFVPMDDFGF